MSLIREPYGRRVRTTTTYELELRDFEHRLCRLEEGFGRRLNVWIESEQLLQRGENTSPSLESFVEQAVLQAGGIDDPCEPRSLLDSYCFHMMVAADQANPQGEIGIFSAYGLVPTPACFFTFDWHSDMLEMPHELSKIAHDVYFAMRQLAPGVVDAVLEGRIERSLRL